jgi:hypothetical protein
MRLACQAAVAAPGRLVCALKAKGQENGEHALENRLAIVKQLKVRRFMLNIDGDGPVFSCRSGLLAQMRPPGHWVFAVDAPPWR